MKAITKSALLSFLKKYRSQLQHIEGLKPGKKGGLNIYEKRNRAVNVKRKEEGLPRIGLGKQEMRFGDVLGEIPSVKRAMSNLFGKAKKTRVKMAKVAKKYRRAGGKLSDYKSTHPTVTQLRKIKSTTKQQRRQKQIDKNRY